METILKPNQPTNVSNKTIKKTSETWWEVLKKPAENLQKKEQSVIIKKPLTDNKTKMSEPIIKKRRVAEKTWAKMNLMPTNSKQVSKVSDDLISEARKFKSADEFIESVFSKRAEKQRGWSAPSWKWETLKERMAYDWDVTLREELTKHIKQPDDYFHWYLWPKKYWNDSKTITAIKKWMEDWEITIYRAVPKNVNSWRDWDWVYFVKDKAITHWDIALDWKYNILEKKVSIDDVFWDWNDINEWWYDSWLEKSQLKQIYEQAQKSKLLKKAEPKVSDDLISEARKYKSAEDIKTLPTKDFVWMEDIDSLERGLVKWFKEWDIDIFWNNTKNKTIEDWAKWFDFKEPVEVSISKEWDFTISDWHHRALAWRILNKEIPVIVKSRLQWDLLWKYISLIKKWYKRSQIYKSWNEWTFEEQVNNFFNKIKSSK